jgi:hypothetical protein
VTEHRVLVRVQMPDRPGALGLVASRVGAVKGDIVGIEIVDRTTGDAVDELAVVLPDAALIDALRREITEVDGTDVESIMSVSAFPEPRLDALRTAARLVGAHRDGHLDDAFVAAVGEELRADWCALVAPDAVVAATPDALVDRPTELRDRAVHVAPLADREVLIGRARPLRPGEIGLIDALRELVVELESTVPG